MRVIAGSARSLRLSAPEGKEVRPTIDRFKETVFNIIGIQVPGAKVLDLFAGSGANGIEALSRGAASATFVENGQRAMAAIEANLKFTKLFEKASLMKYDYIKALTMLDDRGDVFDIIYMDPPFNQGFEDVALTLIASKELLAQDGLIVCESDSQTDITAPEGFEVYKEKTFKQCKFTFLRRT